MTALSGTLVMTRTLPAPPETVWRFLTEGPNLLNWWGPEGTTITDNALDFRRTGPWHATMVGPSGHGASVGGHVLLVNAPHAVTLTLSFDMGADGRGPESEITFALTPDPAGTLLTLTQTGLDPAHIDDMMNKGWNSALGRLIALVENA